MISFGSKGLDSFGRLLEKGNQILKQKLTGDFLGEGSTRHLYGCLLPTKILALEFISILNSFKFKVRPTNFRRFVMFRYITGAEETHVGKHPASKLQEDIHWLHPQRVVA